MDDTQAVRAKRVRVGERTMLACIGCKQRKLKCDAQTPKCLNCVKSDRDCLVEDPATGLHRPRNYLQTLETRVAYLEALLQDVRPDVALDHFGSAARSGRGVQQRAGAPTSPHQENSTTSPSDNDTTNHQTTRGLSGISDDEIDQFSSDVALLALSASGREPHYFGPSSAVSFSRIASQAMGLRSRTAKSSHDSTTGQEEESHRHTSAAFPNAEIARILSHAYFDNIHPQYPFLHQPTFRIWEKACLEAAAMGDPTHAGDMPFFFVMIVYAIGSLALGHNHNDSAENYYAAALDHIGTILDTDSLASIQCMLACAVYSIRSAVGASLWKVSGMALRLCVELGYHTSTKTYRRASDILATEMSKRCFWVAYDIDRVVSFTLGRPAGVPDHAIDVELPLDLNDEDIVQDMLLRQPRIPNSSQPPTNMTGAIHVIKLRRLWSKFSMHLYSSSMSCVHGCTALGPSIEQLRKELEDWKASIPVPEAADRSHSKPLSVFASREWFSLAYDYSVLMLYRHYLTDIISSGGQGSRPPKDKGIVDRAFEECYAKSRDTCLLYRRVYQRPSVQFTWGSLHILFLSAVTFLYCLWRSDKIRQSVRYVDVVNTCMACTTVLTIIAERWNPAASYRDIFEKLSERTISMVCGEVAAPPGPSDTFELPNNAGFDTSGGSQALLQDWITDLNTMYMPPESDWLVQEFVQGVREFEPNADDSFDFELDQDQGLLAQPSFEDFRPG